MMLRSPTKLCCCEQTAFRLLLGIKENVLRLLSSDICGVDQCCQVLNDVLFCVDDISVLWHVQPAHCIRVKIYPLKWECWELTVCTWYLSLCLLPSEKSSKVFLYEACQLFYDKQKVLLEMKKSSGKQNTRGFAWGDSESPYISPPKYPLKQLIFFSPLTRGFLTAH